MPKIKSGGPLLKQLYKPRKGLTKHQWTNRSNKYLVYEHNPLIVYHPYSSWTIEGLLKDNPKKPGEGIKELKLQQELQRLQEEKEKTEAQLRKLEDEKKRQTEEIEEKANQAAKVIFVSTF